VIMVGLRGPQGDRVTPLAPLSQQPFHEP
jgi:hypothetical protein